MNLANSAGLLRVDWEARTREAKQIKTTIHKVDKQQSATVYPLINQNRKESSKEHMYLYNWLTFLYSRNEHNIENQLYSN